MRLEALAAHPWLARTAAVHAARIGRSHLLLESDGDEGEGASAPPPPAGGGVGGAAVVPTVASAAAAAAAATAAAAAACPSAARRGRTLRERLSSMFGPSSKRGAGKPGPLGSLGG